MVCIWPSKAELTEMRFLPTGTLNGAGSILLWCPEKGFGIAILTNVMSTTFGAGPAIALSALDRQFGFSAVDWIARYETLGCFPHKGTQLTCMLNRKDQSAARAPGQ